MMPYNYPELIKESSKLIPDLIDRTLENVLINVVNPEFNVVYLVFSDATYSIHGEIGGEYLGIHKLSEPIEVMEKDGYIITEFEPFKIFVGHKIAQIRQMGVAWNGHGYEVSFYGIPEKTMIIQSMDVEGRPEELVDCLRLGVGFYHLTYQK
jgi:hypothetical protein